jgi:hypothetical protein
MGQVPQTTTLSYSKYVYGRAIGYVSYRFFDNLSTLHQLSLTIRKSMLFALANYHGAANTKVLESWMEDYVWHVYIPETSPRGTKEEIDEDEGEDEEGDEDKEEVGKDWNLGHPNVYIMGMFPPCAEKACLLSSRTQSPSVTCIRIRPFNR